MNDKLIELKNLIDELILDKENIIFKSRTDEYLKKLQASLKQNLKSEERSKLTRSFSKYVTINIEPQNRAFSKRLSKLIFEYDKYYNLVDPDILKVFNRQDN